MKKQPEVPQQPSNAELLDRILSSVEAEGQPSGAHQTIVAGAWVDMLRGSNPAFLLATHKHKEDAVVLSALARILPPQLAQIARDRLSAGSSIDKHVEQIADILKVAQGPRQSKGLRGLFGGESDG